MKGKPIAIAAISVVGGVIAFFILIGFGLRAFFTPNYPTPELGYVGEWRPWNAFPVQERPLPPASQLWSDYQEWSAESDEIVTRLYIARMGSRERQSNFTVRRDRTHNMPLGDYMYTWVTFDYQDPTNGIYHLQWDLPGEHEPEFLRFDEREWLFLLQVFGSEDRPQLSIKAVEGTRPFYGASRETNGTAQPDASPEPPPRASSLEAHD